METEFLNVICLPFSRMSRIDADCRFQILRWYNNKMTLQQISIKIEAKSIRMRFFK